MNKNEEYLKQKIAGLKSNPKRMIHEALNHIQGKLMRMLDADLDLASYWEAWASANKCICLLMQHWNSETEIGRKLMSHFMFMQKQMRDKPSDAMLKEIIDIIYTIKQGFA